MAPDKPFAEAFGTKKCKEKEGGRERERRRESERETEGESRMRSHRIGEQSRAHKVLCKSKGGSFKSSQNDQGLEFRV